MGKVISTGFITNKINGIAVNSSFPCKSTNYNSTVLQNKKYIVIHYTGNSRDTAKGNANYFHNSIVEASAHFFVDDTSIYQSVKLKDIAWSVGVLYGNAPFWGKCNNANSINIEMCCTAGNFRVGNKAITNTIYLTAFLCKKLGIGANQVDKYLVRHFDVCAKKCPAQMSGNNNLEWKDFKGRIKSLLSNKNVKTTKKSGLYPRAEHDPVGKATIKAITIKKGTKLVWVKDDGWGWSKVKYKGKYYWIVNSRINRPGLSSYKQQVFKKGTRVRRLSKRFKFETDHKITSAKKFRIICQLTKGKYKGCYYGVLVSSGPNNGRKYYIGN